MPVCAFRNCVFQKRTGLPVVTSTPELRSATTLSDLASKAKSMFDASGPTVTVREVAETTVKVANRSSLKSDAAVVGGIDSV
ncbi:hypothetical protein D3C83_189240 [compost metagenome]